MTKDFFGKIEVKAILCAVYRLNLKKFGMMQSFHDRFFHLASIIQIVFTAISLWLFNEDAAAAAVAMSACATPVMPPCQRLLLMR